MKYRWSLAPPQPLLAGQLASPPKLSPLLVQCLLNRGLSEPDAIGKFLQPRLRNLADPFLLPNMAAAVDRLFLARERGERLVIFGDYDVDGVTSTTLLLEVLRPLGWRADYYLPSRLDEGYGLSPDGAENCLKKFPTTLVLAVDCGSTAVETVASLRSRGVDTIVLDHHQISHPAPEAVALVNPQVMFGVPPSGGATQKNLPEGGTPNSTELCSAGLAFKLAHAILKRGRAIGLPGALEFDLKPLLDLVALGTIADLVPLTGENRILVSAGLARLNQTRRPGLLALRKVAESPDVLGTYEVGFQLAPRLNAAGRLYRADAGLELLLTDDPARAAEIAAELDAANAERRQIERRIRFEAEAQMAELGERGAYVLAAEKWHPGVIGIVASRLVETSGRPVVMVALDGESGRGSGRSIAAFDLLGGLTACGEHLVRFGGHRAAAGIEIERGRLEGFATALARHAEGALSAEQLAPVERVDAVVDGVELSLELAEELGAIAPFGHENPPVCLMLADARFQDVRPMGEGRHARFTVTSRGARSAGVCFGQGRTLPVAEGAPARATFALEINEWNGVVEPRLRLRHALAAPIAESPAAEKRSSPLARARRPAPAQPAGEQLALL